MSKYVHVVKAANHLINDDYIARVVKNHRVFIGAAAAKDGKITVAKFMQQPTTDAIKAMQESFKDTTMLVSCGDVKNITEESMQPFVMLKDDNGDPICVVALDGDFDRHKQPSVPHSSEFQVTQKIIQRKLEKWSKSGGIEGVVEELNDDANKDDFALLWQERGSITFLFGTGEVITLSAGNTAEGNFTWGYVSNNYGYLENVTEKKQEEKPVTLADKMAAAMGLKKSAPAAAPQGGTVVAQATQPPKTDVTPVSLPATGILIKPDPKVYDTRKKLSGFYEARLGHAPNGYKSGPALLETVVDGQKTYTLADTKSLQTLKHTVVLVGEDSSGTTPIEEPKPEPEVREFKTEHEVKATPAGKSPMPGQKSPMPGQRPAASVPQTKNITPTHVNGADNRDNKAVITAPVPMFSPDQKKKIADVLFKKPEFAGVLSTEDYKPILDPKEMKTMDKTFQNFMEGFGKSMDNVLSWPFENHMMLAQFALDQKDPKIAAKLSFDLVRELITVKNQNKHLLSQLQQKKAM